MKLLATCTPFEALPPSVWAAVRKQLENVGKTWGLDITVEENPTVTDAIANFWKWTRLAAAQRMEDGQMSERKYRRIELSTPLWEVWIYEDGSVSVGEVHDGKMGFEHPSLHIHPADVVALVAAVAG